MKLQFEKKELERLKKEHEGQLLKLYKYTFTERETGAQKEVQFVLKEPSEASVEAWAEMTQSGAAIAATRQFLADNALGRERAELLSFLTKYVGVAGAIMKRYSIDFQGASNREAVSLNL